MTRKLKLPQLMSMNQFDELFNEMNELFEHPFNKTSIPYDVFGVKTEDGKSIKAYEIEIPSVKFKKEDISISVDVENGLLNIIMEKNQTEDNRTVIYHSISTATKKLSFKLGDDMDIESIESNIKDGLLTIKIPIAEKKKTSNPIRKIEIK